MLDWIAHPYTADPRLVDFMPLIVEPIAQQAGDEPQPTDDEQPTGSTQPTASTQQAGEDSRAADSMSTSSSDRQSPQHQSPQHQSPPSQSPIDIASGNTESIHLSNSEVATTFSHPSSESPLITIPQILPVPPQTQPKPPTPPTI